MKARDSDRLQAIRMLSAAVKLRAIELREKGQALTDGDVIQVLQKSAKQRRDSIDSYRGGNRPDLAEKEEKEMSANEVEVLVAGVVAELGATSPKDMGRVMAVMKTRAQGLADNKIVSECVKRALTGQRT